MIENKDILRVLGANYWQQAKANLVCLLGTIYTPNHRYIELHLKLFKLISEFETNVELILVEMDKQ